MRFRRRKRTFVPRRSDLTPTRGRFWAPDSGWNLRLTDRPVDDDATRRAQVLRVAVSVVMSSPQIVYCGPNDPIGIVNGEKARVRPSFAPTAADGTVIMVDLVDRSVVSGTRWRRLADGWAWECEAHDAQDLDGEGWDSIAGGLVLERELLGGKISHALALEHPDLNLYGRLIRIPPGLDLRDVSCTRPVGATIGRALQEFGGYVVATNDEPRLVVRCERSSSASDGRDVGASYRSLGIGSDQLAVGYDPMILEVLA